MTAKEIRVVWFWPESYWGLDQMVLLGYSSKRPGIFLKMMRSMLLICSSRLSKCLILQSLPLPPMSLPHFSDYWGLYPHCSSWETLWPKQWFQFYGKFHIFYPQSSVSIPHLTGAEQHSAILMLKRSSLFNHSSVGWIEALCPQRE